MLKNALWDRIKKWLSSLLIFVLFATQIFDIPTLIPGVIAAGSQSPNLVSVIVSESTNSGSLKSRIKRYASDIQANLSNTRVIIVEVPDSAAPHTIAALNEKLYYEGDGNGISKLVGTVLIGKLPIPVVHKGIKSFLSIFPYTDFDDKVFVYDTSTGLYQAADTPVARDTPEIWHGVIQPNTGTAEGDATKLAEFLDKTHAFYSKTGVFAQTSAEPSVIYLDLYHDQNATKPQDFKAYNTYLKYLEDLSYNRYNKYLAKELYDTYQSFQDPLKDIDPTELKAMGLEFPKVDAIDFTSTPDIQTRPAILKSVKQFFEVFNEKYIGDILKAVNNTGRYGDGKNTRVDIAPVLISKRDEFMKRVLKDGNTTIEWLINSLVKNGISRDVLVPKTASIVQIAKGVTSLNDLAQRATPDTNPPLYQNYYFGRNTNDIQSASDCTIVRGSSITVEANRGFNVANVEGDVATLGANARLCFAGSKWQTGDLWGGNSPLGIKTNDLSPTELAQIGSAKSPSDFVGLEGRLGTEFKVTGNRYNDYVRPTFDLRGQKEIKAGSPLKVASPLDCTNENFIADPYSYIIPDENGGPGIPFYHPVSTRGTAFACVMQDSNDTYGHKTIHTKIWPLFAQVNDPTFRPIACNVYTVTLDGGTPKTVGELCMDAATGGDGGNEYGVVHKYTYKKVPSWIEHTSPNSEEYGAALKGMVTPSLATDKDRYIDFLTPAGTVVKIEYPNLYRLKWNAAETLTAEIVRNRIKEVLDAKTKEISDLIARESPSKLTGGKLIEYNLLKRAEYPSEWIDLYSRLAGAGNALDTIVDTVLWYNEENVTSKYAFVLEHYLDSDGNSPYPLAGLKKDYEIAYIGGAGDAQNMFVKIDPEAKNPIPKSITDIQGEANALANLLVGANMSGYSENGAQFKCGPPEWVPIWQWLPAVFCWLGSILPPTTGAGSCGNSTLGAKSAADAQFFMSQKGLDGNLNWQSDRNNNGILDGYEWVKDGVLELAASPRQLSFLSTTELKATLTKDSRILAHDSFNQIKFEVKRLILKKGQIPETLSGSTIDPAPLTSDRVVFSKWVGNNSENGDLELLKKYITFTPIAVRAENGEAKYMLGSKTKELDVILEANVSPIDKNGQPAFVKRSSEVTLEIRNSGLKVTPITQTSWAPRSDTRYEAGIAKSITYNFAVTRGTGDNPEIDATEVKRPIAVTIYDEIDGKVLAGPTSITSNTYIYNGDLLKQAGSYRFEFLDATGRLGVSSLTILPAKPVSINAIASSSVFVKGQKNTILVRAVDAFGNIARGNVLKFSAKLSGGGYFVQNSDTKLEKSTVEWLTSFDISSNSGGQTHTLTIEVDDGSGKKLSTSLSTTSVDRAKIALSVSDSGQLIAGGATKKVEIAILDGNGAPLTRFNGIASLNFPKNSGQFSQQFVTIRDGRNLDPIEFIPGTLAVQNATADISIPGINEISGNSLTILPAAPMRVALTSSVAVLEARAGNSTEIQATLYDRFANVAYNHSGGLNAQFTIPDIYTRYGTLDATASFNSGIARTTFKTTKKPGSLYYAVEVTPGLESNSFEVTDKSGARLNIKGYWKNVALLETFYLWNAEKLKNTNYSPLSTTLLGADYGNVTVPNYLGGEMLFAPASRSLAVTTLLSSGKLSNNLASITPAGKLTLDRSSLARVDVGSSRGRTTLALYDPFRRESIGQFYLNLPNDTALIACGSGDADTLNDCPASTSDHTLFLRGIGKTEVKRGTALSLTMDGISVLDITPRWEIRKYPSIELVADSKETKNLLSLSVTSNGVPIGRLGVKIGGKSIIRSLPTEIDWALQNNPGNIIYEASSPRYAASSTYLGNSSYGAQWLSIAQREDTPKWADRDMIGSSSKLGLEQYMDKQSIGFGNGNNTLLEFAWQSSVGESTRAAATYSQIILGDPVARLPELKSQQNYDRTLGKRLSDGNEGIIETSIPIDYNNDGQEDILVMYESGKVELLQNFGGTYRSLGYVIYVVDAGPERKWAGNFSGTGYSSIVMSNTEWNLIVIENQKGKFVRVPTRITLPDWTPAMIKGSIMQLETFDMDWDGKLDVISTDDSGELNILYGSVDSIGLYFTKKNLDTSIGLRIWSGSLIQGGAMRWTGIREVSSQTSQADYVRESKNAVTDEDGLTLANQRRLLDSKIYYTQSTTRLASSPAAARSERLTRALWDDPNTPGAPNTALASEVQTNIASLQSLAASGSVNTSTLDNPTIEDRATFLRSEFGEGEDLKVERNFTDRNGGTLQAGDRISVNIAVTNKGNTERRDFQYLDSFDKTVFHESENTKYAIKKSAAVIGSGLLKTLTDGEFDYQFWGFGIWPKETITIEYELVTNAVRYGKFKVGILETDDLFGDVSMNANAICGDNETLYKSIDPRPRSYVKTLKSIIPLEDPSGSKGGKFTDFNGNKQPDYIDLLSGDGEPNEIRSSLWDPTTQGILVFREVPKNGIIDGKSFQIGRIILDTSKEYIQSNPISLGTDIPVLPRAEFTGLKSDRPDTIYAGNIPTSLPPVCGKAQDITELQIEGLSQEFKISELADLTGTFKFVAIGTDKATGNSCSISITENSSPSSDGKTVTGIGWKLLTKSTFAHYGLAGTQADIVNTAAGIPDTEELRGADTISFSAKQGLQGTIDLSGISSTNIDNINSGIDTIVQWLGCGFGGGSCLSLPMNWAPLAPGSAPVIMGTPIFPLRVDTGRPVFSALTCRPQTIACGTSSCSIGVPSMYPVSDYNLDGAMFVPGANNAAACTGGTKNAAGGSLGVNSVSNFFRFFVTPTLTGAVGVAACYGGPARIIGNIPPKWVSPVIPGGNCIVAAAPLFGCTDDGSDGNISDLGSLDTSGTINAAACRSPGAGGGRDQYPLLGVSEQKAITQYVRSGGANASFVKDILQNAAGRGGFRVSTGPFITIGNGEGGSAYNLTIDKAAIKNFDRGTIERINHERVSAFPDFMMDWVNRQLEEVSNKLTSLPTLYITKPDFRGALDDGFTGFGSDLQSSFASGASNGSSVLGNAEAGRTISGVKAAYEFMSRIPLIKFEPTTLNITYPDIGKEDLNKIQKEYEATRAQWQKEIDDKKKLYATLGTREGIDTSVVVEAESLVSGIDENIRVVESYKKFPDQLAKYLTWKERYAKQLLCNITAIQGMLDGFISSNAQRFKAWVEFNEMLKNILKGWQLIPDLFYKYDAECGVCRNERYDAKQYKFKLISSVIPPLPIIRFPKWPDIMLDLHNVRMGLRIAIPEFSFTPTPIILPTLPRLQLPTLPKVGVTTPGIQTLPSIPPLPELPNLPSLPTVTLPELPPPPTIPKLFGSIKFTLNILKIVAKVMCLMRSNPFVPEWRAGDQIAQITERQGKLGIDFLNIEFPQFNASFVDAIKVTTFVNFEFQIDFLIEMARATFEPISNFTANMSSVVSNPAGGIPGNIDLRGTNPGKININLGERTSMNSGAKSLARAFIATVHSGQNATNSNASFTELRDLLELELAALVTPIGSEESAIIESMRTGLAYRADDEVRELKNKLSSENAAKFWLATRFVESEIAETETLRAAIQWAIDSNTPLSEILGGGTRLEKNSNQLWASSGEPAILTYSAGGTTTESPLPDFSQSNKQLEQAYVALSNAPTIDPALEAEAAHLKSRVERLSGVLSSKKSLYAVNTSGDMANVLGGATDTATSNQSTTGVESSAAQNIYRGIYSFDNARQIRLFDYTDELTEESRAIGINRLRNGAKEFIYLVSGALYLKTRLGNSPLRPSTESVTTMSVGDLLGETTLPSAPNHFKEQFAKSGEIQFDFTPANSNDSFWALNLYDYIDRYARTRGGESLPQITPRTTVTRVDLIPDMNKELTEDLSRTGLVVKKPFGVYASGRGEGLITGSEYRVLGSGQKIRIGAGKSAFSDGGGARVIYKFADIEWASSANQTAGIITLGESLELKFERTMDIEVLSGNLLLETPNLSTTPRTIDLSSLKGFPILVGSKISFDRVGTRLDMVYHNGVRSQLNSPSRYEAYALGSKSKHYSVALNHPNGWEYASLTAVSPKSPTRTEIRLLSPQIQADREGPLLSLTSPLRAPVYIGNRVNLAENITDTSGVRDLFVDEDLNLDSNGDGKKDNDPDSRTGTGIIRAGSGTLDLIISPQKTLFERPIKLWATDEAGNVSSRESRIVIYSPIPTINTQSGTIITGQLDELLEQERVDLVRFRSGKIDPIGDTLRTTNGVFSGALRTGSGLILKENGVALATINEYSGVVNLTGSGLSLRVVGASESSPTTINLVRGGSILYSQALALSAQSTIEAVSSLAEARSRLLVGTGSNRVGGAWVRLANGYTLVKNTSNTTALPGGVFVTGIDRKGIFGISKDGNVYLMSTGISMNYATEEWVLMLRVLSASGEAIADIYYLMEAEFVIK